MPILGLRPVDAARAIGVSPRKLWEVTADKSSGIPHVRLGKCVVYPVGPLTEWLAARAAANGKGVRNDSP
ncbi:MAG: DNA-binding protein [Phycisphaerales bacterium]|nr:DNA-binding protein [Phycisphaerales bacterium]